MRRILAVTATLALLGGTSACGAIGNVQRVAKAANELAHGNKQLNAFIDRAKKAQSAVYVAEYKSSGSNGAPTSFRIAQKPPKSVFESNGSSDKTAMINDGTDTYTCSGTPVQCLKASGTGQFSTAAFANYLNPASFVQLLAPLATLANFDISNSSRDVAGQHSECVTITNNNKDAGPVKQATYCTTDNGIFSYASDKDGTVEMTKYSTSVSDAEFKLPGKVVDPTQLIEGSSSTTSSSEDTTTTTSTDSTTTTSADATTTTSTSAPSATSSDSATTTTTTATGGA